MAAIANDSRKQVLIFKQSAGTGFDAPRAFVLASTKSVNDADFALQFMGRVMRVDRTLRTAFAGQGEIPAALNTAFVYLANAEAQAGYEAAVQATSAVQSQLEGQTERLAQRRTLGGAVVYTNLPTDAPPLSYEFGLPLASTTGDGEMPIAVQALHSSDPQASLFASPMERSSTQGSSAPQGDFWGIDELAPEPAPVTRSQTTPSTRAEVLQTLSAHGLRAFERKQGRSVPTLGESLRSEEKPSFVALSAIAQQVARELPGYAARAALLLNSRPSPSRWRASCLSAPPCSSKPLAWR